MALRTLQPRVATMGERVQSGDTWRGDKSSTQRGYGYKWQQARAAFIKDHPLCQCPDCDDGRKRTVVATVVDHRIPHRGDQRLFWDQSNWSAMAKACHDLKTGRGE